MEKKEKIVKLASKCFVVSKVFYVLSIVLCLVFAALAIALPLTLKIQDYPPMYICSIFIDGALVTLFLAAVLWNTEKCFETIKLTETPFSEKLTHYLKKVAIFIILMSAVPALVSSIVLKVALPDTENFFNIDVGGIICGVIVLILCMFFGYGDELQQKDNETL